MKRVMILRHPKTAVMAAARALGYCGSDDKLAAAEWVSTQGLGAEFQRAVSTMSAQDVGAVANASMVVTQPPPIMPAPSFAASEIVKAVKTAQAAQALSASTEAAVVSLEAGTKSSLQSLANDLTQVANRTANAERNATNAAVTAQDAVATLAKTGEELRSAVAKAVAAVNARPAPVVDAAAVSAEVSEAIAQAFKPFRQAVADVGAEAAVGALVSAQVVMRDTAKKIFGVTVLDSKGQPVMVDVWDDPGAPAIDPTFIWSKAILSHLLLSQSTGENVWFGGDKGTGKSETARQFAARTGRGFTRINFHKYSASEDYLGATGLQNGSTAFEPQAFLKAFTSPGTVVLLDEPTNADPGNLAPLNGLLEPGAAVSIGGQVWRRAPGVLVFAADNTLGSGDQSGRYAGTREMNSSLIDRFPRIVRFEFLPKKSEVDAVVRHTGCRPELAEHVIDAVNIARQKVTTGDIVDAPSIRSVIGFIRALQMMPVADAWQACIAARQPAESALALEAIRTASISDSLIQGLI